MPTLHVIEVDQNFDAFQRQVGALMTQRAGEFVLLKSGKIVSFYQTASDAFAAATERFGDDPYSVQEIRTEPEDLGIWSHV